MLRKEGVGERQDVGRVVTSGLGALSTPVYIQFSMETEVCCL